jgi:hypothetical protein
LSLDCYAAKEDLFPAEQTGFRKGFSSLEQTYILHKILNTRKQDKTGTTFLCFIDLQPAFPSCWRKGMWRRLHKANIRGKVFCLIKSLYLDCSSALLTNAGLSNWSSVSSGTHQGAVCSPFLFSLLISSLVDEGHAHNTGIAFFGEEIGCPMFAKGIVLIADFAQTLHAMLDVCTTFFSRWRFTVSADKTRVVSLEHCETLKLKDRSWQIGGTYVKDNSSDTYLRIEFDKSAN